MLPRIALRAVQSSALRHIPPITVPSAIRLRSYASNSKPPRPPPPPINNSKPIRRAPPPSSTRSPQQPAKSARQTSPGTSFPKDETWRPQDGIKFGGPAATTVSGAGVAAVKGNSSAETTTSQSVDSSSLREVNSGHVPDARAEKPLAQEINMDQPSSDNVRGRVQEVQAQAENISTPEPSTEPAGAELGSAPRQPLPDLRQGLPSTFEFEFGQLRGNGRNAATQQQSQQQQDDGAGGAGLDVTYDAAEAQQQRDRGERDYDNSAYETSLDRRRAQLANYLYASILAMMVGGAVWFSRPFAPDDKAAISLQPEETRSWSPSAMYARIKARWGDQLGYYTEPTFPKLLPDVPESQRQPLTLVLSLEDLMIHSTWDREHGYRTAKRPGIDYFIRYLFQYYELVLFTSVPIAMADPVIKKLDPYHFIMWPLGREATKYDGGEYVKDLTYLNRDLKKTIIIDTEKGHVKNQPENAIVLPKWSGNPKSSETKDLVALIPFLEYIATMGTDDVRTVLKSFEGKSIPEEFARREAEARKQFYAQLEAEKARRPRHSVGALSSALGIKSSPAMSGGMVLADGQSVAEGLAQGKMLSDQIREQGQKQYEALEKQIRENGEQWLKEEKEEIDRMTQAQMKDMKASGLSWFSFGGGKKKDE